LEIIVVSDGSTDGSAEYAGGFTAQGVRILELRKSVGKAAAVTAACEVASGQVLVFSDVRQRWADDAFEHLVANFADERVGAVSGCLLLEKEPGVLAGVGLYWRFETWLRATESRLWSQVGVTGAISACRRELFCPIPAGTVLDDVYWPICVSLQGYRVVFESGAKAFDRLPSRTCDEFRRKVRTLAGNFQLLHRLPLAALLPWMNCIWWQFISHKLLRLLVPWAMLGAFFSALSIEGPSYQIIVCVQLACYVLGLLGIAVPVCRRVPLLSAAGSFILLNAAAFAGFWVWVGGRTESAWHKVDYRGQLERSPL
jgi:cellulose synthase/poly-beta-1,6-N-acetylglucosamine synthase-like glycosyltransferase